MDTQAPGTASRLLARARRSAWPCLAGAAFVALGAVLLRATNDGYYEQWVNFDPQTADEQRDWMRTTAFMVGTSGCVAGQLVAGWVGAAVRRLPDAVVAGTLLAAVNLAVLDLAVDRPPAGERGLPAVLAAELLAFPLAAAAGAGLASRRRRARFAAVAAAVVAIPLGTILSLPGVAHPIPWTLGFALPPAAAIAAPVHVAHGEGQVFTVLMTAGYLAWAVATLAWPRASAAPAGPEPPADH
jgi:hypothetical protein